MHKDMTYDEYRHEVKRKFDLSGESSCDSTSAYVAGEMEFSNPL